MPKHKTFTPERTVTGRIPWLDSDRFVRLNPFTKYTVIPDKEWPKGEFGFNANKQLIKASALALLTGEESETDEKLKVAAKSKATSAKKKA